MTTERTPGPWGVARSRLLGETLFDVYAAGSGFRIAGPFPKEREADAHLIAAAPDLLTALRGAVIQWEAFVKQTEQKGDDNRWHRREIAAAKAVIAKAEGTAS